MGEHDWDRAQHGKPPNEQRTSWKAVAATLFFMLGVFVGPATLSHPATCDNMLMDRQDRCVHHGRSTEELVSASDVPGSHAGYSYNGQIMFNRVMSISFTVAGTAAWVVAVLWCWRRWRDWRIDRRARLSLSADE